MHSCDDPDRPQRVPAELEEVVRHADPFRAEDLSPDAHQDLLDWCTRGDETRRLGPRFARLGQRLAIDLAVGRQRQRVQHHEDSRDHVFGQALLQESTQLRRKSGRTATGHHVGRQVFVAWLVFPRQDDRRSYRRVPQQHRLDLSRLDPVAADLHLLVDPTEEFHVSVRT